MKFLFILPILFSITAVAAPTPPKSENSLFDMTQPHIAKFAAQVHAENNTRDELKTKAASPEKKKLRAIR